MGQTIIVTGARGFVGKWVVAAALEAGKSVIGVDVRPPEGRPRPSVTHLTGDLRDRGFCESLRRHDVGVLIHLAAYGGSGAGLLDSATEDPVQAVDVNVGNYLRLHSALAETQISRFVWSSSITVYSRSGMERRVSEAVPVAPDSVYGVTKAICEQHTTDFGHPYEVAALRLPYVYGPGRDYGGTQGELMRLFSHLKAGQHVKVRASRNTRSWITVRDAARALVAAAQVPRLSGVFNVDSHQVSEEALFHRLCRIAQVDSVVDGFDETGVYPLLDGSRFRGATSWEPLDGPDAGAAALWNGRYPPVGSLTDCAITGPETS